MRAGFFFIDHDIRDIHFIAASLLRQYTNMLHDPADPSQVS